MTGIDGPVDDRSGPTRVYKLVFTGDNIEEFRHALPPSAKVESHMLDPKYFPADKDLRQLAISEHALVVHRFGVGDTVSWIVCGECGEADLLCWFEAKRQALIDAGVCLGCDHFLRLIDNPRGVRINHEHYMVGDERGPASVRGYGGARHTFKMFDGTTITTTDLWSQGTIPEHFWTRLPDNATWVEGARKDA